MYEGADAVTGAIRKTLSVERLESYRLLASDTDVDLLSRYLHNIALCESLYPVLHIAEVTLRNAIDSALNSEFKGRGHNEIPSWLDANPPILIERDQERVADAIALLREAKKTITPGRLIAEMGFGFWVGLLSKRYETTLWPKLLKAVIPHAPNAARTRHNLYQHAAAIKDLRNRVFHHEPIWRDSNLLQTHATILEMIGWISPETRKLTSAVDRFQDVWRADRALGKRKIDELINGKVPA